jgi:hypothetical protein
MIFGCFLKLTTDLFEKFRQQNVLEELTYGCTRILVMEGCAIRRGEHVDKIHDNPAHRLLRKAHTHFNESTFLIHQNV